MFTIIIIIIIIKVIIVSVKSLYYCNVSMAVIVCYNIHNKRFFWDKLPNIYIIL